MALKRIVFEPFEHLFQHIKQSDVRLYEALKRIVGLLGIYEETVNEHAGAIEEFKYHRTLVLKNTTVGDDIADHVTIYHDGRCKRVTGVLRVTVASDLKVRINRDGTELTTITIPSATDVDSVIIKEMDKEFKDGQVLSWDVTASDGKIDAAGVATITVEWE